VEQFKNMSGTKQGLTQLPDGQFQTGMVLNIVEKGVSKKINNHFNGQRHLFIGRIANQTSDLSGHSKC